VALAFDVLKVKADRERCIHINHKGNREIDIDQRNAKRNALFNLNDVVFYNTHPIGIGGNEFGIGFNEFCLRVVALFTAVCHFFKQGFDFSSNIQCAGVIAVFALGDHSSVKGNTREVHSINVGRNLNVGNVWDNNRNIPNRFCADAEVNTDFFHEATRNSYLNEAVGIFG